IAQRIVFADAELKSEVIAGLLLVGTALLLQVTRSLSVVSLVMPVMMGLGIGLVSGRFLLFFIKLSRHCQRGTSQSTYNISWETGLWTGLAAGFLIGNGKLCGVNDSLVCSIAFWIVVVVLLLYNFATHKWYLHHKNR
ncbi:MAG: MFS transporter, partial [Prevotella sp.]|nr:MFS transporter [Prevotella sp.]